MPSEHAFSCDNNRYYIVAYFGYFIVQRQDWFERTFVGFVRDIAAAMTLIHKDAKSGRILAA